MLFKERTQTDTKNTAQKDFPHSYENSLCRNHTDLNVTHADFLKH